VARVVRSTEEIGEVRDGEILVCSSTSPAWAPIFSKIKATVTDVGGVMSHAAIVCREYGLPAVVGTGRATSQIRTGQRIQVDGTEGIVTILDEESHD
jgi:pyruvate,water dikinase